MEQSEQNKPAQKLATLNRMLRSGFSRLKFQKNFSFALILAGLFSAGLTLFTFLESTYFYDPVTKFTALAGILLLSLLASFFVSTRFKPESTTQFSSRFLNTLGKEGEQILSALDLSRHSNGETSVFHQAAIDANLTSVEPEIIQTRLNDYLKRRPEKRVFRVASILSGLFILSFVLTSLSYPDATQRTVTAWESYDIPNPFQYTVSPGSTTVEQGQEVTPSIEFTGDKVPENVLFAFKTTVEDRYRERPMQRSDNNRFEARTLEASASVEYYIIMDDFESERYDLSVEIQPRFEQLITTVIPPDYTQLPERELEYPFTNLSVYPGSVLRIDGELNKPVSEFSLSTAADTLQFTGSEQDTLNRFQAEIIAENQDTLRFFIKDFDGLQNQNPYQTILNIRDDENPVVVVREPMADTMINEPEDLTIVYEATDDFGLEEAQLAWSLQRAFVDSPEESAMDIPVPQNGVNTSYTWNLDNMDLRPRDVLRFHIRVMDNDQIAGGKWGRSGEIVVRIPSLAEFFDEMDSSERDVQQELDNVSENFDQMSDEYERFLQSLRQNPDGGFEEQEMLENISEQQQEVDETVEKMKQQFDELRREMGENESVSEETQRAYRELQQLMEELDDPSLQDALSELREAMENMNPNQLEQAMENVDFNEELYKERLERTQELFKTLKMNSDLDKLAEQYEDLSQRMDGEGEDMDQIRSEMESAGEDIEKLSEQLERLDSNPPKRSEEALKERKEQSQQTLEEVREQMENLAREMDERMQEGETDPSGEMQEQQEQMSQKMQQEADNMRKMQQEMNGQQLQVNLLALQRALYTLLELSDSQEFLTRDSQETSQRSAGFVDLARQQRYVRDQFASVADSIFQISSEIPGVPNRINTKKTEVERTLRQSVDEMAERNQRRATIASRESLGGINDLSSMIASLIDQLMNQGGEGGGGGGMSMQQMIEQMQQMSGDQQQLNQQIQDMVNDMQGDRLNREQTQRLDQLARQQNEIRKQLEELQQSGALRDGDKALSELQRMMDEMEDSINDMRGGVTDELMIERQQNILSRMLSAEEAMEQRGEDEEREGRDPDQRTYDLPPDMTLEELQQEIRSRLQDPEYSRFSEEYQRLIERYFERIQRMNSEEIQ